VYSSVSVVHRARKLLKRLGFQTQVVQLPSDLGLKGCNYGMECFWTDLEDILQYSKQNKLKVKAVFRVGETESGRVYTAYDLS